MSSTPQPPSPAPAEQWVRRTPATPLNPASPLCPKLCSSRGGMAIPILADMCWPRPRCASTDDDTTPAARTAASSSSGSGAAAACARAGSRAPTGHGSMCLSTLLISRSIFLSSPRDSRPAVRNRSAPAAWDSSRRRGAPSWTP
ncbi:hypothetical protein GQ55_1G063100 [Panicum hallii var. hallii]|uniref:Uncharacterized protein n=1 Tax=Panicum hallii var. hallii TaxID=1504633 RepID=A0A2T7F2V7_9POAL|nr:hypothetical protein GQ55_1G063100 [Panicum hallii var. hallii]